MWYGGPWGWNLGWFRFGGFGLGILGFFIMFIGVVYILRWLFGSSKYVESHYRKYSTNNDKYLEILKERYANGEITREEFEKIKKDLEL